jgi:hypothetical protein
MAMDVRFEPPGESTHAGRGNLAHPAAPAGLSGKGPIFCRHRRAAPCPARAGQEDDDG